MVAKKKSKAKAKSKKAVARKKTPVKSSQSRNRRHDWVHIYQSALRCCKADKNFMKAFIANPASMLAALNSTTVSKLPKYVKDDLKRMPKLTAKPIQSTRVVFFAW